jgi:hypothetical protein
MIDFQLLHNPTVRGAQLNDAANVTAWWQFG